MRAFARCVFIPPATIITHMCVYYMPSIRTNSCSTTQHNTTHPIDEHRRICTHDAQDPRAHDTHNTLPRRFTLDPHSHLHTHAHKHTHTHKRTILTFSHNIIHAHTQTHVFNDFITIHMLISWHSIRELIKFVRPLRRRQTVVRITVCVPYIKYTCERRCAVLVLNAGVVPSAVVLILPPCIYYIKGYVSPLVSHRIFSNCLFSVNY